MQIAIAVIYLKLMMRLWLQERGKEIVFVSQATSQETDTNIAKYAAEFVRENLSDSLEWTWEAWRFWFGRSSRKNFQNKKQRGNVLCSEICRAPQLSVSITKVNDQK